MDPENKKELTFEEAMSRLEQTAEALKKNDTTLDDAIRHYEEGVALYERCSQILNQAKQHIQQYDKESGEVKDFQ